MSNDEWYHLKLELVSDTNSIVLCPKLFENTLEHQCRISRGYDYVIISSLSELSKPYQNAI